MAARRPSATDERSAGEDSAHQSRKKLDTRVRGRELHTSAPFVVRLAAQIDASQPFRASPSDAACCAAAGALSASGDARSLFPCPFGTEPAPRPPPTRAGCSD